jgi:hypothetical protein
MMIRATDHDIRFFLAYYFMLQIVCCSFLLGSRYIVGRRDARISAIIRLA